MAFRLFIFGVLVLTLAHKCFGLTGTTKRTTSFDSSEGYKRLISALEQKQHMFEERLHYMPVTSVEERLKIIEHCKSFAGTLKDLILEFEKNMTKYTVKPPTVMVPTYLPVVCERLRNYSLQSYNAEDVFSLITSAQDDIKQVLEIFDKKTGATDEVIQALMPRLLNGTNLGKKSRTAVIGAYIERKGGVSKMTVNDFRVFSPEMMFSIPIYYFNDMKVDVLNDILDFLYTCTVFVMELHKDDQDFEMDPGNSIKNQININPGQNDSFEEHPYSPPNFICLRLNFFSLMEDNKDLEKAFCNSLFRKYKDIASMHMFRRLLFMMYCAPVATCQAVPNIFVQENIDQLRMLPWPCNQLMTKQIPRRQMVQRVFTTAKTCGRIIAEKTVSVGENALDIKNEKDWKRMGLLSSCLSDDYLIKAAPSFNCSMVAEALDEGLLPMKVADAVKENCFEAPQDPTNVTCSELKSMGGFIASLPTRFLEGIPKNETCEPSCMQFLKKSLALPVSIKKTLARKCFGGDGVVLDFATVMELGGEISQLPIRKLDEISGRDILNNLEAIKESIDMDMKNKGRKAVMLTKLAEKIMETAGIKELAKHEEFMHTISVKELKSSITDVVKDLGLDDPEFIPNFPDSQNKFLMKKMLDEKTADNFTVENLRSLKSLVKGFLSYDIENLGSAYMMEKAVVLCEQTNWPMQSLKTINRFLIKGGLDERSATQTMLQLTPVDVSMLGCECLIHFEPMELLMMTIETCMSVCHLVGTCNNFRCLNPRHRQDFASACLKCRVFYTTCKWHILQQETCHIMTQNAILNVSTSSDSINNSDLEQKGQVSSRPLSAEDADHFGSNIFQSLSPAQLKTLISAEVVKTKQSYFRNACLVPGQMSVLGRKIIATMGSTSGWSFDIVSAIGSNIQFLTPSEQELIDKTHLYNLLETISADINPKSEETERLRKCCERWLSPEDKAKVDEARRIVGVTLKNAIVYVLRMSELPKRRREAVSFTCTHIEAMGEVFATEVTMDEVNAIKDSEFTNCLQTIGSMTGWSNEHLEALLAKSEAILGDVCHNMTTDEVVSLHYIATVLSTDKIDCLPLHEDDVVAAFGEFSTWSNSQLSSLATRYMTDRSLTTLVNITAADITTLGHILCGFDSGILLSIPPSVIGASGHIIGKLGSCPSDQLQTITHLATETSAYGPVANWTAADASELGLILAGLTGEEIQQLNPAAIQGISENIIPKIPPDVLSKMTITQLASLGEIQAASVTIAQKSAMSAVQQAALPNLTGAYLTASPTGDSGSGSLRGAFGVFILSLFLLLFKM